MTLEPGCAMDQPPGAQNTHNPCSPSKPKVNYVQMVSKESLKYFELMQYAFSDITDLTTIELTSSLGLELRVVLQSQQSSWDNSVRRQLSWHRLVTLNTFRSILLHDSRLEFCSYHLCSILQVIFCFSGGFNQVEVVNKLVLQISKDPDRELVILTLGAGVQFPLQKLC